MNALPLRQASLQGSKKGTTMERTLAAVFIASATRSSMAETSTVPLLCGYDTMNAEDTRCVSHTLFITHFKDNAPLTILRVMLYYTL